MSPEYCIITPRLALKLIPNEDANKLRDCVSHSPSLHRWIDWCEPDFTLQQAERFLLSTRLNWVKSEAYGFGVYRRYNEELIGMVAINEIYHTFNMVSVGYWIRDSEQHNGYAKEAVDGLVNFCFEQLKITRVEIVCDPDNKPSQRLAEQCGAVFEATARNRFIYKGQPRTGLVYSVVPE
ncbi:GNAT family N-acetyltransferase [Vibrio nereis]|uniref:Ribosomal-protein-serine acetyltransferase n=1 Tax=Vibrio nereis TaxID=693 RepID=A0A0M0HNP1_VIBNE|nr:GNAT family protein [Vibrio nereis]KOO03674.1 ribosomal-protein-serine acetyltransferase [Vibrio nereis]